MHWWMKTLKMIYLQFNTKNEFTFVFYFRFCFWGKKKKRKVEKKNKIRIKRRGDRKTRKQTLSFRSFRFVSFFSFFLTKTFLLHFFLPFFSSLLSIWNSLVFFFLFSEPWSLSRGCVSIHTFVYYFCYHRGIGNNLLGVRLTYSSHAFPRLCAIRSSIIGTDAKTKRDAIATAPPHHFVANWTLNAPAQKNTYEAQCMISPK